MMECAALSTELTTTTSNWESNPGNSPRLKIATEPVKSATNQVQHFIRNYQPLQIDGNGYRMGLTLVLDANVNDYSVTNGKFDGFKVIDNETQKRKSSCYVCYIGTGSRRWTVSGYIRSRLCPGCWNRNVLCFYCFSLLTIYLNITFYVDGGGRFAGLKGISTVISNQAVSTVPHKKRGCVVDGEVQLNYFTRYSQSACVAECTTRKMQKLCNCRPYFFRGLKTFSFCLNTFLQFNYFQLKNQFHYVMWKIIPASPRFMVGNNLAQSSLIVKKWSIMDKIL